MKKALFFLILTPAISFAGNPDYDKHFDDSGPGGGAYPHYDEFGPEKPVNPFDFYEDRTQGVEMPAGLLDTPTGDEGLKGIELGSSVSGRVAGDDALSGNVTDRLQNGTEMETLGDTFVCPTATADNYTEPDLYADKSECDASCMSECRKYTFTAAISCQNAEEIIKVSPVNPLAANTPLRLKYRTNTFTTPPVTAICGNGFLSDNTAYEWAVSKEAIEFVIPGSRETLGECVDVGGRTFMASFTDYYTRIGAALNAHVSRLGFVASHTINSDMTLSVSVIVAGACGANSLQSGLPHSDAIEKMSKGELSNSEAMAIAQSDDNFKMITNGADHKIISCEISNTVTLYTDIKTVRTTDVFNGSLPDITRKNKGQTWVFNYGTSVIIQQAGRFDEEFAGKLTGRFISSSLDIGTFVNSNGDLYTGCQDFHGAYPLPPGGACKIENRWIESSVPYVFTVLVEKDIKEDIFSLSENDGCSATDKSCKLTTEAVCDMKGANCVYTRKNGVPTGAKVKTLCNEIVTGMDKYSVCSDGRRITAIGSKNSFGGAGGYFTVKREYSCDSKTEEYDYSSFLEQSQLVSESAKLEGDSYSFQGRNMDGSVSGFSSNVSLEDAECSQTCKVKAPPSDNVSVVLEDGSLAGVPTVTNPDGSKKLLPTSYYKSCVKKGENWECPIEPHETLVAECACDDDFTDAILQLQFVDESSKNMKCSGK